MRLNNSCLKLALAALMILLPGIAWGNDPTYDYAATLTVKSTGNGKVYASESPTLSDDIVWQSSESTKTLPNKGTTSTSWSPTLYAHAKAETGYEFTWNDSSKDNPKSVKFNLTKDSTSDTKTITATFSAIQYKITYELGGGTNNSSNPNTYTIEDGDIMLGDPTRTGYKFTGWTLTGGDGNWAEFIGSQINTISKDQYGAIELTAGWNVKNYTIKFNTNGGSSISDQTYQISDEKIELPKTTLDGYVFTGWTASFEQGDSDHGGWSTEGKYSDGQTITTNNQYYGNVTLTAGWDKEAAPSFIRVNLSGMLKDDHAIFNISYEKQGQTVNQQIAIHEYAIVKIPGGVSSVTVMPSKWTEKTYTITTLDETTQDVTAGDMTFFNFSAMPKSGQNIFETSREF